jgi:mRNA-degrading endonuclease RelE of RelBE toxin-antitoxin system
MHEIQKTTNFRFQYNKLNLRFKRWVDEAIELIKESPTEFQGKITHLANKKDGSLYRYRMPGIYLLYVVPNHEAGEAATITLTAVKMLR